MKFLHLILILVVTTTIQAQAIEVEWEKSFGGISYEDAYDIIQTPDSNILIVGEGGPWVAEFSDCGEYGGFIIVKINEDGELLWSKCYGGNEYSLAHAVINCSEGGYAIIGETFAYDGDITGAHGNMDFWVIKVDDAGELEWQLAIGGSSYDSGNDIVQTNEGDYLVVGNSSSINGDINDHHETESTSDLLLAKISSGGELIWTNSYGGIYDDYGESIAKDSLDNIYLTGYSFSASGDVPENKGSTDLWVLKVNTDGGIIWSKSFGGSETDIGNDIAISNGYIYTVGETYSNDYDVFGSHGGRDGWLIKLTIDGELEYQKCFGGSSFEELFEVEFISGNEILLTGISGSNNGDLTEHFGLSSKSDFWAITIDTIGNLIWQKSLGGSLGEYAYAGLGINENQFIITGTTYSSDGYVSENGGGSDMWTVKLKVCYDKYFADIDGDGFGDVLTDSVACNTPSGYVSDSTDCIDTDPDIHPFLSDICNSIDDNCNGATDEDAIFITYYLDNDGDFFGDILFDSTSCNVLVGYVENSDDCNDVNAEINPLISETCNGIDDNCNIEVDEGLTIYTFYIDVDGDTYGNPDAQVDTCIETIFGYVNNSLDCNDTIGSIYPGAIELCNYLDDDCDGLTDDNLTYVLSYQDNDGDDFGNPLNDSLSCELPVGYVVNNTDCDDTNAAIYPGAEELLNGIDDDCDQIADEGLTINDPGINTLTLHPNPTFSTIQINATFDEVGTYTIYSSTGQLIISGVWNSGNQTISVITLAPGVYSIQLEASNSISSGFFVKL
ncbi:MAG TPA: MopE-related protein [Chitinophagales bacterium]|nr:MopE-related protein [Chitinophagales bacterium]HRG28947.1 MopE-related protein [Chitinophagales bacterium]HRG29418.1 MopE-related protein [Chitinophagales bacterium]HRG85628.1 MopE-related protein [Chitinophagales bacterium]HRH54544.1 MopE-related protein [Chitinophagales bacterium]